MSTKNDSEIVEAYIKGILHANHYKYGEMYHAEGRGGLRNNEYHWVCPMGGSSTGFLILRNSHEVAVRGWFRDGILTLKNFGSPRIERRLELADPEFPNNFINIINTFQGDP